MAEHELYLAHHGVKGMKWGVRRYQNPDGSLTAAGKERLTTALKKDYKRNYESARPFKTSEAYDETIRKVVGEGITADDKKRVSDAYKKWRSTIDEANKAEEALNKLAEKYGRELYDDELRRNPGVYDTPRSKQKLLEYCTYDDGYDKARKARPDLAKAEKASEKAWDSYKEECKKVSDSILGSYGNTKLYECKYYSYTIRDTVGDMVSSMDKNWQFMN